MIGNHQLILSVMMLLSLFVLVPGIIPHADAQGVDVGVGVDAEIVAGGDSQVSSETKTEGSAEVESAENENTMAQSTTEMKGQSSIKTSYPKISADSESQIVIQSKQMLYQPGETIIVEGSLWTALMSQLGQTSMVTIQILDSQGSMVNEKTVELSGSGSYDAQIDIPPSAVSGEYTIRSEIVADSTVLSTLGEIEADLDASSEIIVSVPTIVTVSAQEHGDFEVEIASSSKISQVEFSAQEKTLAFQVEGETGANGVTQIKIPKQLLSGQITILIDGHVMAADDVIMTADTEAETEFELNYSHSAHTVEIVGTNAVPEFGQITVMILTVSLISLIAVFRTKLWQNLR